MIIFVLNANVLFRLPGQFCCFDSLLLAAASLHFNPGPGLVIWRNFHPDRREAKSRLFQASYQQTSAPAIACPYINARIFLLKISYLARLARLPGCLAMRVCMIAPI
jgi:hypothetical protein